MRKFVVVVAALACALSVSQPASAQRRGASRGAPDDNLPPSVPPPISTLSPTRGISGPRLQPGAVLCSSEIDLRRRAEVTRRRAEGTPDPGNPLENCHLLREERGVDIVERRGFGMTQVKVKPTGETGWTDSYLR